MRINVFIHMNVWIQNQLKSNKVVEEKSVSEVETNSVCSTSQKMTMSNVACCRALVKCMVVLKYLLFVYRFISASRFCSNFSEL